MMNGNEEYAVEHPEVQAPIALSDAKFQHLQLGLNSILQSLKASDAIEFKDITHAPSFRALRGSVRIFLQDWPPSIEDFTRDDLEELILLLNRLENASHNAVVVGQVAVSPKSPLGEMGFFKLENQVPEQEWQQRCISKRREQQLAAGSHRYEKDTSEYNVAISHSYNCSKCLTNDHLEAHCDLGFTCLRCLKRGHYASSCEFQLCKRCARYGHGNQRCRSLYTLCIQTL